MVHGACRGVPCEGPPAGACLWRLRRLSGEDHELDVQARVCRRAGHRYFAASLAEGAILGACLPNACAFARPAALRAAALRLLPYGNLSIVAVEAFTDLGSRRTGRAQKPATVEGSPAIARQGAQKSVASTEWADVELFQLCSGADLPAKYFTAQVLAIAIAEFHGGSADYIRAVHTCIVCFVRARRSFGYPDVDTTVLVAGALHRNYGFDGNLRIRAVPGVPPCGRSDWRAAAVDAALGLELWVPPMWRLANRNPQACQKYLTVSFGREVWNYEMFARNICDMSPDQHLSWAVPADAAASARALAARGPCARQVATHLLDLAGEAAFFPEAPSVRWGEVKAKALRCLETLEGAFWEVHVLPFGWPVLLGKAAGGLPAGPSGTLFAFLCVPTRFAIEESLGKVGAIPAAPACNAQAVVREALPLLLAFASGRYEELFEEGPPAHVDLGGGERAPYSYNAQLVAYQAAAHRQWRQARGEEFPGTTAASAAWQAHTGPGLSAAVCVLGLARTWSYPEVHRSVAEYVTGPLALGAGVQVSSFFVLDLGGRPLADFAEAFRHVPPTKLAVVNDTSWGQPPVCEAFRHCGKACELQFHKLLVCRQLVVAAEASRGRRFDWLLRLRPDLRFRAPVGGLAALDAGAVHAVLRLSGMSDLSDHFALVPRVHMDAYFGVFDKCPSWGDFLASRCMVDYRTVDDWVAHVYPECVLKMRLDALGVRIAAFPKVFELVKFSACGRYGSGGLWSGLTRSDACGAIGN